MNLIKRDVKGLGGIILIFTILDQGIYAWSNSHATEKGFLPRSMKRYQLTPQPVKINLNKLSSSLMFMVRSCSDVMVTFSKDQSKLVEYTIQKNKAIRHAFGLTDETYEDKGSELLQCNGALTSFWVTWNGNKIQIGKGIYIDRNMVLDTEFTRNIRPEGVSFWSKDNNYTTDLLLFDEETDNGTVCPNRVGQKSRYFPLTKSCYHFHEKRSVWREAEMACKSHGGHLASIGSFEELIFIAGLFANENKRSTFFLGAKIELVNGTKVPRFWTDGRPFTFLSSPFPKNSTKDGDCVTLQIDDELYPKTEVADCSQQHKYICRIPHEYLIQQYERLKKCPMNQYTCHDGSCIHLSNMCDAQKHCKDGTDEHSECGYRDKSSWCPWWQFQCNDRQCVAASAFCNCTAECRDLSDERICHHPGVRSCSLPGKTEGRDRIKKCRDTRTGCFKVRGWKRRKGNHTRTMIASTTQSPAAMTKAAVEDRIHCFNGDEVPHNTPCRFNPQLRTEGCADFSHLVGCEITSCGEEELKCAGGYCVPKGSMCDGKMQCTNGVDELCGDQNCPEQFTCKISGLCIPSSAVCDGHIHCPYGDDEHHCTDVCPEGCNCFDQVANCTKRHHVAKNTLNGYLSGFPKPVYNTSSIDLSSNWHLPLKKLQNWLKSYPYLFHLNLAGNDLNGLGQAYQIFEHSKNLRSLDMSDTNLQKLHNTIFDNVKNLRILKLKNNNIKRFQPRHMSPLKRIQLLDIANISVSNLKDDLFEKAEDLRELYLNNNKISNIGGKIFKFVKRLRVLDLRGNPVKEAARYSLFYLKKLKVLLMPASDLCCLTDIQEARNVCQSQFETNETKECLPLIQRVELRAPLLILTVWILIGNLAVIMSKLCQTCGQSAYRKFPRDMPTISLGLCYFYQGVYLVMILTADGMYDQTFETFRNVWRKGYQCQVAGYLLMMSLQVSSIMMVLLIWDGVVLIANVGSRLKATRRCISTFVVLLWIIFITAYMLPLLPLKSIKGTFYNVSDFCAPILQKLDYENIWAEPFLLVTYIIDSLAIVLILVGLILLACQNKLKGGRWGKQPGVDGMVGFEKKMFPTVFFGTVRCGGILILGFLSSFTDVKLPDDLEVHVVLILIPGVAAICPLLYLICLAFAKKSPEKDSYLEDIYAISGNGSAIQQGVSNTVLASAGLMPTAWMPNPAGAPPSYCSSIQEQPRRSIPGQAERSYIHGNNGNTPLAPPPWEAWMARGRMYDCNPTAPNESLYSEPFDDERIYSSIQRQNTIHPPSSSPR